MGTAQPGGGHGRFEPLAEGGRFEIRVRGTLGEGLRSAFDELTVTLRPAETVMYGAGIDQTALYGILDRIQALGLELLEVRGLPPSTRADEPPG
ncbi:hypothetical protein [Streptomyces kanamyceticus]|uniref:Uncharacterized protein n=1 Tax=Streptomyces kanamyceticus TaxID=1967 RepID=A0A5J6GFR8_STRKN|nr:hypothetical protein [Streptomyces kanamyceticus]QEU93312.1 hypothetical protein CP970_22420 [Streptomyces kanamyceticus]